jgi:hypothetical protein
MSTVAICSVIPKVLEKKPSQTWAAKELRILGLRANGTMGKWSRLNLQISHAYPVLGAIEIQGVFL